MNQPVQEKDFLALLSDTAFDKIELELKAANFFNVLKATRNEIRHSNFLAWLLDPNENHGLNEMVLLRFLRDIFSDERAKGLYGPEADTLDYQNVEVRREWQSIDLLILIEDIVIVIENKVDSKEHSNQLIKYKEIVDSNFRNKKKVFVYLTAFGEELTREEHTNTYIEYSYLQMTMILERIMTVYKPQINERTVLYLEDYINVLRRNIMQDDELNELAAKLYKAHKNTLDFIFENRPDLQKQIQELAIEVVESLGYVLGSTSKAYIRFLTPGLNRVKSYHFESNGWLNKEVFLFELIPVIQEKYVRLVFKSVISPGDNPIKEEYISAIEKVKDAKPPYGKKWIVHFTDSKKIKLEQFEEYSNEEMRKVLFDFLSEQKPIIENIEKAILANPEINKS